MSAGCLTCAFVMVLGSFFISEYSYPTMYFFNVLLLSGELSLQVLVAPSLVAPGKGLFLCIYDDIDDDSEDIGAVEEIIIPQGKYLFSSVGSIDCNAASSS